MKILIEGKSAQIKKGSSFEYVAENRLFMGRDEYTLSISFPLKDCPANREIFGLLERKDVTKEKIFYECELIDRELSIYGSILINGVSESEVKAQFVANRCEQNANDPFENVYINELDLGEYPSQGAFTPLEAINRDTEVALPWINEAFPTQSNNWFKLDTENARYVWTDGVEEEGTGSRAVSTSPGASRPHPVGGGNGPYESHQASRLSWQPYLIMIAKRICEAIGYTYDFAAWEQSPHRYILICNTLPYTWDRKYKDVLPHWTVTEFFEKLELLMLCEFDIDHKRKHIGCRYMSDVLREKTPVKIDNVLTKYDVDISQDGQSCKYIGAKTFKYKEGDHIMKPYYSCDWFIDEQKVRTYENVAELVEKNKRRVVQDRHGNPWPIYGEHGKLEVWESMIYGEKTSAYQDVNKILYARQEDTYFVWRSIGSIRFSYYRPGGYAQIYVLQPINVFGNGGTSDNESSEEIGFAPVCITDTYVDVTNDMGYMMSLSFGDYTDDSEYEEETEASTIRQPITTSQLLEGEKDDKKANYDVIYIGYWRGWSSLFLPPAPLIDGVNVTQDFNLFIFGDVSFRLKDRFDRPGCNIHKIIPTHKYKFSFISDRIPDPRSIFHICGKRYVCEKITATFTENGMSQLLKGEFYQVEG